MNDCLRARVLTSNVWTADDEIGCTVVKEPGCECLDSIPGRVDRECIDIVQMSCMLFKLQEPSRNDIDSRSDALKPSAGDPFGHVLNSHGEASTVAGALEDPVPDLFSAGHESTTCSDRL